MALNERYAEVLRLVQRNLRRFPPPDRILTQDPLESIAQALCYHRLSKDEGKKLNSIQGQNDRTHDMCTRLGWEVLGDYDDLDISGKSFDERPAWDRLVRDIGALTPAARGRTAIVFKSVDRFGRSVGEMETTRESLEETGARLRFADYPFLFPETVEGYIAYMPLVMLAAIERKMIVKRTNDALDLRRRHGVKLGKFPKAGFTKDADKRAVPDESTERLVNLRIAGESYGSIAQELGIDKSVAYDIASFLRREVERGRLKEEQ